MSKKWQLVNYAFHAMGSPCHVQFYAPSKKFGQQAKKKLNTCLASLEQRYSRYREDSLISTINRSAGLGKATPIDSETAALLTYAQQCYQESDGLFDVTSGILRRIWSMDKTALPNDDEINELLPLIGWDKVQWSEKTVYLPLVGMQLDFGGIVKEYAADSIAQLLQSLGVVSGIVELGGDIKVIGPQPNGQGWPVAIRDPRQPDKVIIQLNLFTGALASSGDYERFQLIDGVRYSHLLNPKTGKPVTGLRAVSILSEHCVVAGSVATLAMLKGDQGLPWLQENQLPFFCCQNDGQIYKQLEIN
ncbi:FAD:protein FMN transferase [methanotrophic endosymbiont of Bathymodiolus puteoserpentis (Logatchev)]|jgi:thiamine biosynthesis lipoprotein|uniref:FAD:protein FMN transferase n=1 Tax=methanotrophic endosymbiont of Bathymodiolus puteoserpentis (Logatchev) TaxID=343235 RepID=UPI0013CB6DA7|nr:FAD:protein FMN transferase [methanotrophic endosymbiont of Bathymodiolus puteoserpentis (Logatchev)]SHE23392.1 Thiamin biosynthesis lipoprotein ApbE [methanotrophic endosymbiont of Bathymodiolus puteoserpentis (Logatchev)]